VSTQTNRSPLTENTVVDVDVHLRIPLDDLAEYCDEPYRSTIKHPTYTAVNRSGWDRYMGGNIQKESLPDADTLYEKVCDGFDIDYPLINAFPVLASVPEDDRAVHMMRAYNDYLLDNYLDEYDEFRGLLSVATQDPEAAAEEIERMSSEEKIEGVYVLNSGAHLPLGHPDFDVMYRAAADHDLHIAFHASAGAPFARDFPIQDNAINRFMTTHVLAHPWAHMLTMTSLLVNGTPEKFPDLNFTFLEAGLSWVPYMLFRLNKEYGMRRREAPLLEKSPEEYIREQFYFASQPMGEPNDPQHLKDIIDIVGTDSLLLATDYPHWDFDHPDALDRHLRQFYPEETREGVLADNAVEAFDLSL
jgi:predicted TIM-barrel fold metal-dependent hydrolase